MNDSIVMKCNSDKSNKWKKTNVIREEVIDGEDNETVGQYLCDCVLTYY